MEQRKILFNCTGNVKVSQGHNTTNLIFSAFFITCSYMCKNHPNTIKRFTCLYKLYIYISNIMLCFLWNSVNNLFTYDLTIICVRPLVYIICRPKRPNPYPARKIAFMECVTQLLYRYCNKFAVVRHHCSIVCFNIYGSVWQ